MRETVPLTWQQKSLFLTICHVILPVTGIFRRTRMLLVLKSQRNMYLSPVLNLNVQTFTNIYVKRSHSVSDPDPEQLFWFWILMTEKFRVRPDPDPQESVLKVEPNLSIHSSFFYANVRYPVIYITCKLEPIIDKNKRERYTRYDRTDRTRCLQQMTGTVPCNVK